jgi:hypothetical protein
LRVLGEVDFDISSDVGCASLDKEFQLKALPDSLIRMQLSIIKESEATNIGQVSSDEETPIGERSGTMFEGNEERKSENNEKKQILSIFDSIGKGNNSEK